MKTKIKSAIIAIIAFATTVTPFSAQAATNDMEKCYGIVKAGMNDCATAKSSCAGSATQDKQSDAFIFLPKGVCDKILGGSLQPKK